MLTPARIGRLMELNQRIELTAVVDEPGNAGDLAAAAEAAGKPLRVLIDVDVGSHRTGVTSPAAALTLANLIGGREGLELGGLQGYAGHVQHIADYGDRKARIESDLQALAQAREALRQAGFEVAVISGGGTGSHRIDAEMGLLTEIQVGSYVFCDADYDVVGLTGEDKAAANPVISVHWLSSLRSSKAWRPSGVLRSTPSSSVQLVEPRCASNLAIMARTAS